MLDCKDRLIGMLDVLGFSNRLESMRLHDLVLMQSSLIERADREVFNPPTVHGSPQPAPSNFERYNFLFDSIVLVSKPTDTIKHVSFFITAVAHLMELFFANQMPLRGAITFGDYIEDSAKGVALSPSYPELVRVERNMEWSGCCVLPPASELVQTAICGKDILGSKPASLTSSLAILPYDVPMKTTDDRKPQALRALCLNWINMMAPPQLKFGLEFLEGPKKIHTEKFVEFVRGLRDETLTLDGTMAPACLMKIMKTRSQMRIHFLDHDGNSVDPGAKQWTLAVFDSPQP